MAILKHIDFEVSDWGDLQHGPEEHLGYRARVLADSPLMYLRMSESTGPTAYDESATHHAAEVGVMNWGVTGPLRYDTDTAVGSPATGGLSVNSTGWLPIGSSPRTVELFYRPNTDTIQSVGISYGAGPSGTITFVYSKGILYVTAGASGFGGITPDHSGQWHHVAFVFPESASRLDEFLIYIDGSPLSTQTYFGSGATAINTIDSSLLLNMTGLGSYSNCDIDEVAIYDTALPAQRIKDHYNAAVGRLGQ